MSDRIRPSDLPYKGNVPSGVGFCKDSVGNILFDNGSSFSGTPRFPDMASFNAAGGAADYGDGPVWIGGELYQVSYGRIHPEPRAVNSTLVYRDAGSNGITFSGGANTPSLIESTANGLYVTTPVGAYSEINFPAISARLNYLNCAITIECDDWDAVDTTSYYTGEPTVQGGSLYGKFWIRTFSVAASGNTGQPNALGRGLRTFYTSREGLTATNSPDFATSQVELHKFRVTPVAGRQARFRIVSVEWDLDDIPSISLTFDDGYVSVYNNAMPVMNARGIRGSFCVIGNRVGSSARYVTIEQLHNWVANGHDCIVHGPAGNNGNGNVTQFGDANAAINDMIASRQYLIDNGLATGGSENVYVWPQGVHWYGSNRRDTSILDLLPSTPFRIARGVNHPQTFDSRIVGRDVQKWMIPIVGHNKDFGGNETTNINRILQELDNLHIQKKSACLMFHEVGSGLNEIIEISTANFTAIANKIQTLVRQGRIINPFFKDQIA